MAPDGTSIQIFEQGGHGITIWQYLKDFKKMDNKEIYKKLMNVSGSDIVVPPPRPEPQLKFVYPNLLLKEMASIGIIKDGLFLFLEKNFGYQSVVNAYRLFNITPMLLKNGGIGTTFWYVDKLGRILHDKTILYNPETGKRDHSFGGCRRFKTDYGYRGRCYFGEHLLEGQKKVSVVESEKTSLLYYLYYRKLAIATGGVNNLREIDKKWILLPDWDDAGESIWVKNHKEQCIDWVNCYKDAPIERGWDIGDVIIHKIKQDEQNRIKKSI